MLRSPRRTAVLALAVPLILLLGVSPANAAASMTVTANTRASLNAFRTVVTVSGTYTCTDPVGGNQDSGIGGQVSQIYKGNVVVSGGGGFGGGPGGLTCDNASHPWSFDIQAFDGDRNPAVWKSGKAIFQFGGGVSDGPDCENTNDCAGDGGQIVIQMGR